MKKIILFIIVVVIIVAGIIVYFTYKKNDNVITEGEISSESYVESNNQYAYSNIIIKENSTKISENELAGIMRNWILVEQYNYSGAQECNGTMWGQPWLDNISNSKLYEFFIEANGDNALSKNITANELNKAALELTKIETESENIPFSTAKATEYIEEMLTKSNPNEAVTKVELNSGLYYVYTKNSGDTPYCYVNAKTGYSTSA